MKKRLLKFLCCPSCKGDLRLKIKEEKEDEIIEGLLICQKCRKRFPIIDSIPILLIKNLKRFSKTKTNWEKWWEKVRKKSDIDLYDKLWVQAEKNLGGEPLYKKEHFNGKVILDAGCGNGRYIKSDFSKFGCKEIIAVDLGKQVFDAKNNNKNVENAHFIQANLTALPIKDECLDVIASHGVLHHTPKPKKTFNELAKKLKNEGMMAIYVYHKEWEYFKTHNKSLFLDAIYSNGVLIWQTIRAITSRLPHFLLLPFCYIMAIKSTIEYNLQSNHYTKALGKILQLIPPFAYLGVNFHERLVRNYDHYSATFNYFFTIAEVVDWFRSESFNDLDIVSVPVSIRGFKNKKRQKDIRINEYPILEHFRFRKEWERLYNNRRSNKVIRRL